jgi:uncharacterized membrane protein
MEYVMIDNGRALSDANPDREIKQAGLNSSVVFEVVFVFCLALMIFWAAGKIDMTEMFIDFAKGHEHWELDEIISLFLFFSFYFLVLSIRKWRQVVKANQKLRKANQELREAAEEITQLRGILPICAHCKKIRNDQGYWQKVEDYLRERAHIKFTHGLCPDCFDKLYPELKH